MAADARRRIAGLARAVAQVVVGAPRFAIAPLTRRRHLRWGATAAEVAARMPRDEVVAQPSFNATRAITINAPPEAIWPWIVQLGFGRAGWYTYDLFDNGARPSAERILAEYQQPDVGDWYRWRARSTRRQRSRSPASSRTAGCSGRSRTAPAPARLLVR
ncbi:MAG TPA: hypothetical protein VEK78_11040 [Gemmatimonadales bacterium]|nr:hypothetical protein [Gemmatimonadales bacterium]